MLEAVFDLFVTNKADEHIRCDDLIIQLDQGFVHMDGYETAIVLILDLIGEQFFVVLFEGFGSAFAGGYVENAGINIFLTLTIFQLQDDIDGDVFDHL